MKLGKKDIIIIVIILLVLIGGGGYLKSNMKEEKNESNINVNDNNIKKEQIKIVKSEAKSVNFTNYNNGLFLMKLPEGWKVETLGDNIHYTIKAYNPENPLYQLFFNMKTEGFYKIFNELGPLNNTQTFTFPVLNNFTLIEKLGTATIGGDLLRASFKDNNQKEAEGIFTAYVYDPGPYYVNENVFSGNKIDIYYLNVYNTIFITAPKDEFINWEETLNTMASSLEFSESFVNQFYTQQDAVMKNSQNVRSICNQTSNIIMSSWESRNAAYDRMSQKQSDATLGYERVYDTETGDIYKAYNGFTDDYDGKRYQSITEDMYSKSIEGYIEK